MLKRSKHLAFRVSEECVAFRCRKLARQVTRLYDEALREHQLTAAQFSLLGAIELKAPIQAAELARILGIEKSTLSRNLGLMVETGWVDSQTIDGSRAQMLALTEKGRITFLEAMPDWERAQASIHRQLGEEAAVVLDQMLGEKPIK